MSCLFKFSIIYSPVFKTFEGQNIWGTREHKKGQKGSLSTSDFEYVFQKVIRKELKVRGCYGDEYGSNGPDSHVHSEENKMIKRGLELAISGFRDIWAFLEKKNPEEEWISTRPAIENTAVSNLVIFSSLIKIYFCYLLVSFAFQQVSDWADDEIASKEYSNLGRPNKDTPPPATNKQVIYISFLTI
jgi:hypothetical protein